MIWTTISGQILRGRNGQVNDVWRVGKHLRKIVGAKLHVKLHALTGVEARKPSNAGNNCSGKGVCTMSCKASSNGGVGERLAGRCKILTKMESKRREGKADESSGHKERPDA